MVGGIVFMKIVLSLGRSGIDINIIYFSGFSGQGDGACFEGSYQYKKGGLKALIDYAPQDEELHYIAKNLQSTQRKAFYQLTANVKHRGHYYHELCTYINIRDERDYHFLDDDLEEEIKDELRSFMQWIYGKLEKEYEWLTSKEAIIESIEANEYTFKSNGELENL